MIKKWIAGLALCLLGCAFCLCGAADTRIVLTLGGDCVLGTREEWKQHPDTYDTMIGKEGFGWSFANIAAVFQQDDISLVNLEGVLQDNGRGEDREKQYRFRGPVAYTRILTEAGIEQVNIANNHFIDYGAYGRQSTRTALRDAGIAYSGYGDIHVFEKNGVKIGFGGCRETVYRQQKSAISRDIQALQEMGCAAIVYSVHWGREYSPGHNLLQQTMAQYAIDCGANLVVGTHPHCVQGIQHQDGAVILYSLGNLVFGGTHEMTTFDALVVQAILRFGDTGRYHGVELKLLPVLTSSAIPQNNFQPQWAEGQDKERILQLVQNDSSFPIEENMWFVGQEAMTKSVR